MSEHLARAQRLAAERADARAAGDFQRADSLRNEIAGLGFDVKDTPTGPELILRPLFEPIDPQRLPVSEVSLAASVHVLYEGYREDLVRFLDGLSGAGRDAYEVVVTDNASGDGAWLESLTGEAVVVIHLVRHMGWAESRNAAARLSRGATLIFADLSVEPRGDIITPLVESVRDPAVGICGPWGLISRDLRRFEESPGPEVDAIEGYLLAVSRELFLQTLFDPWFGWYRHADLELSFRLRAQGFSALVVPVPAERHEHRGWSAVPEPERSAQSKRNFYRFLDSWRHRPDLLVGGPEA